MPSAEWWQVYNIHSQISVFALAAVLSALCYFLEYRLLLWRQRGKEVDGDRIWKNLRRFSGWISTGCLAGIVTFSLFMQSRFFEYESRVPGITMRQKYELQANRDRCFAAHNIFYSVFLICFVYAKSMLLRRVSDHASHSYYNVARDNDVLAHSSEVFDFRDCVGQYALYNLVRSLHVITVLLSASTTLARIVAFGILVRSALYLDQASALTDFEGKDTSSSKEIYASYEIAVLQNRDATAASRLLEAALLLLLTAGFMLYFPACIVMFRRVERRLNSVLREMDLLSDNVNVFLPFEFSPIAADGSTAQLEMHIVDARQFLQCLKMSASAQRRKFILALAFSLIGLAALSSFAVFITMFGFLSNRDIACDRCEPCQRVEFLMLSWYIYTPELLPLVTSLSSALPLIFSLWLMTTKEDRALLLDPSRFLSEVVSMQQFEEPDTDAEARLRAEKIRMGIN
jgi:hypothetical protein